jgi:tRNA(Ile)-lysidine synthase
MALLWLLWRYGRKIVSPQKIGVIHVNHGWRGAESDQDEAWVRAFCQKQGIHFKALRLKKGALARARRLGESPENLARKERESLIQKVMKPGDFYLTGHHAEDLAETVLWKVLTGAGSREGGGIWVAQGDRVRPLLTCRKELLKKFLEEEALSWREDSTNQDPRFARNRMRLEWWQGMTQQFPKAVEHLVDQAVSLQLDPQVDSQVRSGPESELSSWVGAVVPLRAAHWNQMQKFARDPAWVGELSLPDGWRLRAEKRGKSRDRTWVLARDV